MIKIGTITILSPLTDICKYCTEIEGQTNKFIINHVNIVEYVYLNKLSLAENEYNQLPKGSKPSNYPKTVTFDEAIGVSYYFLQIYVLGNQYTGCSL